MKKIAVHRFKRKFAHKKTLESLLWECHTSIPLIDLKNIHLLEKR